MPQPFQRIVVQIDVRQLNFTLRQRIRIDCKIMIVRRNLNLPGPQLLHRMIPAVMSKLQLKRLPTQCNPDNLMP